MGVRQAIELTLHPARYHGHGRKPPFFEGWYYKVVTANERERYAVIPGVFLSEDPEREHAFVQVLDGSSGKASYHRYPAALFWGARDRFEVRVGPNHFTRRFIHLELEDGEGSVSAELHFENLNPWPVSLLAPGIMGWYAWVPFMETYHGVLSLDHEIQGRLMVNGKEIDFSGGRGYMEKDWGAAFPAGYVWLQSNHFETPGTSLTASIAVIPWMGGAFAGLIAGLWHEGRLYRFATYTGAKVEKLEIDDERVLWLIRDGRSQLRIEAHRASGGLLYGPTRNDMIRRVGETLHATVDVELREWQRQERVLFKGRGRNAGLEVQGDLSKLSSLVK